VSSERRATTTTKLRYLTRHIGITVALSWHRGERGFETVSDSRQQASALGRAASWSGDD
jgi:hypothetical protein